MLFPGNRTHDLGVASAMLYHLSYRKASNMKLRIEFIQTRESCFSESEGPLGAFLQIPSVFSCVFTEERIEFGHTAIKPRSVECCSDVCPSVGFSHLHIWSWSSTRVTIRFLVTSITKSLLHQLLSLARRPALGRGPGCFKLLPLRIMEATCFCEPSMQQIFFLTLPQMCGLTQTCFWALQADSLTSGLGFCSDMHYQLLDLFWEVCACPNHTHSMNLPQFNSTRSVVTSTSDMSAPELNFKCPRKGYEYLW